MSATGATLVPADAATQAHLAEAYGQLPLSFELNQGQTDASVNFLSRGTGYALFLTPAEAVLALQEPVGRIANPSYADGAASGGDVPRVAGDVLRMELIGANVQAPATALDAQAGTSNYLIGNDPSQRHTGISSYGRVEYHNVYAGINLAYYGNQQQLEYDFAVTPGANPDVITLGFQGTQNLTLDSQGDLVLHTTGGEVLEHAPVLYQDIGGVRQAVAGSYVLQANHQVGFTVGAYDRSQALIIDPVLSYSTYLGGSNQEEGRGIAVDSAGNAYITGYTWSSDFPTQNSLQAPTGGPDAFVAKLNASGTALVYSTYLGGTMGTTSGFGIAVDSAGNAYVTGYTTASNFPTMNPLQATNHGSSDAFVTKLNATGTALVYSTYLGGSGSENILGIAVDSAGSAYLTGWTSSTNFPTVDALQATYGGGPYDGFVAKLNATGTALVYSTYLGGSGDDRAYAIAVDSAGNAYVTGHTSSTNFPTKNSLQAAAGGNGDAFVTKLNATGTALVYSTYLGGSGGDLGWGIAVDTAGNAYVTGWTTSTNFPTVNALQAANGGGQDAFVAKLNATGTALVYSTYLGGSGSDTAFGIAVDAAGNAYVTGDTTSTNFPTMNPLQATNDGGIHDGFVAEVNGTGTALIYSTYLGGSGDDVGFGIAVDSTGNAYVTGGTSSANFPTSNPLQAAYAGNYDVFVAKLSQRGFVLATPSNVPAGSPFNVTVTATDASGSVATAYTGTVAFTSSDAAAILPASYTFTTADQGVHTFAVTLNTLGGQSLTVSDNSDPTAPLNSTAYNIAVIGPATQFVLSAPPTTTAGAAFSVKVTATDAIGNVAVYYTGTVSLTSTNATGAVTALGSYTFTAADQGTHRFSATLTTAGTQSLTATDANGIIGTDPSIVVSAAAASRFVFTAYPASITAGTPFSVTIAVTDAYGNVVSGYTGTVHFTDSTGGATLPKDYTFTASDQGVHTFTGLVLRTKGYQTLTVIDKHNSSIFGSAVVDVV